MKTHPKLGELPASAICGNDISSSCLYVSALSILYAGQYAWLSLLLVGGTLFLFRKIYGEVAVVGKTASVVEEISIGKEVIEHNEVIRDTVRKTEMDVQNLTDQSGTDADDVTYSTRL